MQITSGRKPITESVSVNGVRMDTYIALGSNLSDPQAQVTRAIQELKAIKNSRLLKVSSLYISQPMGPPDQPDYVNAVAKLETQLSAEELLTELQKIEQAHRRQRNSEKWGPRTLDLDIILFGDLQMDSKRLKIPHAGVAEREFVLLPLQELCADLMIPGKGAVTDLIEQLPDHTLERIDE